jgi:glucose/mannose transport system substrate-binding protein
MKRAMSVAGLLAATILSSTSVQAADVEVVHWWTSGGEQAAVSVFAQEFDATGDKWIDGAIALGETARATIMQRALGGDPPDAAQFNPGRQYEDLIAAGLLLDLTPVAEAEGWADFIRPAVLQAPCNIDGKWWCVPVNLHLQNWAWASVAAFEKAGLGVPATWDEYLAALPKLQEAGVIPFAVGGDGGGWQISLLANQLILSQLGAETVEKIWKDKDLDLASGPEVLKAFQTLKTLGEYTDDGSPNRSWSDTAALVIRGDAALQVMGDWAQGEFQVAGQKPGEDYACLLGPLLPEPQNVRGGGDIFVFFKQNDADVERAQLALASLMVSPAVQAKFNTAKGSAPIRDDVDQSFANDCMKKALDVLSNPDALVPDQNIWRNEAFATAQNAIFSDLIYNDATTAEAAQQQFVELIRNAD